MSGGGYVGRREPMPWPAVRAFAQRHGIPAVRFQDRVAVDEYWPPARRVDGELSGGGRHG